MDVSSFAADQLKFVAAERDLEAAESQTAVSSFAKKELERRGLAVTNLEICGSRTGFGGKTLLELERAGATTANDDVRVSLSSTMRVGDIVRVEEQLAGSTKKHVLAEASRNGVEGVVSRVTDELLTIALSHDDAEVPSTNGRVWLVKLANNITYERMAKSMKLLLKDPEHITPLAKILLGQSSPSQVPDADTLEHFAFFDTALNESQRAAVKHALLSPEVALIHGPPGTGKTYTLIEIVRQLVKRNNRVLVCGASNISVDNIVERLATTGVPLVRIGHPARLLPAVVSHSLDFLTKTSSAGEIVKDIRSELDNNLGRMTKTKGKAKRDLYLENKTLRKEFKQREKKCVGDVLTGSAVVLATLHGAGSYTLRNEKFDVVIIDEASQALEASCWIPLMQARKVILAGDHMQLSPMIKSSITSGYTTRPDQTLFERLLHLHGPIIKSFLRIQYRMNARICAFPSAQLYDAQLVPGDGVGGRLLTDLKGVRETEDTIEPVVFIDTQGGDYAEDPDAQTSLKSMHESHSNAREAELVVKHCNALCTAGVRALDITIVTPYSAQVSLLSALLRPDHPDIEIGTVDGLQGREKEAVIVSLVRSNTSRSVGFLSEAARLNVAMTRAKRHLAIIGDSETVAHGGAFMQSWMTWLGDTADLRYPE